jgi:DNA repair photolyase
MKLQVVNVPSIKAPITEAPGFQKKGLADYKLDLMALCGFGCAYCSSNEGNYLRIRREEFATLTEQQIGKRVYPADDPSLTFLWPDVLDKLAAQLANKPKSWGAGKTLVVSMLTDAFSPLTVANGTTRTALDMVLDKTSFRIRILTKSAVVGSDEWLSYFHDNRKRFVVGLSIGTLDDSWARQVEVGTSSPRARVQAHRRLQDAGIPTFGMLCPVFPDAIDGLTDLLFAIRPERCETVWAEPYNDRANWRAVAAGYPENGRWATWLKRVYEDGNKSLWSDYAASLYTRIRAHAAHVGWLDRLHYLLYENDIAAADAGRLSDLRGVLLQSKPGKDGLSQNPHVAAVQKRLAAQERTGQ